jgi:ATP dependent DNA ligase C terminal region
MRNSSRCDHRLLPATPDDDRTVIGRTIAILDCVLDAVALDIRTDAPEPDAYDQEFAIVGYTAPKGSRVVLGALLLGYHDDGDLVYAGKVGTGFDTAALRSLHDRLSRTERTSPPITRGLAREPGAHWVRPTLVAQVAFSEK